MVLHWKHGTVGIWDANLWSKSSLSGARLGHFMMKWQASSTVNLTERTESLFTYQLLESPHYLLQQAKNSLEVEREESVCVYLCCFLGGAGVEWFAIWTGVNWERTTYKKQRNGLKGLEQQLPFQGKTLHLNLNQRPKSLGWNRACSKWGGSGNQWVVYTKRVQNFTRKLRWIKGRRRYTVMLVSHWKSWNSSEVKAFGSRPKECL